MAQSEAHFGCQRMHNVFNTFRTLFFHHAAAVADKHGRGVGRLIKQMAQHIAVG
jgi:predicted GTPase